MLSDSVVQQIAALVGIPAVVAAVCVWIMRLLGVEGVKSQFKKWEAEHKARIDDIYKTRQDIASQARASDYAKELEAVRAAYSRDAATAQDWMTKQNKFLDNQMTVTTEELKSGLDYKSKTQLSNSEKRVEAYRALWNLMAALSPASDVLIDRGALTSDFRKWYYESGNGLFLTWDAMYAYLFATGLLRRNESEIPDKDLRQAFSLLRTQMKIDISIYTRDEGATRIPTAL